jgi:hypothetical protein
MEKKIDKLIKVVFNKECPWIGEVIWIKLSKEFMI